MTNATLTYTGQLTITTCWCGIKMAIPSDLYQYVSQDRRRSAFCPLGHEWVVGDAVADRLKREAKAAAEARDRAYVAVRAARDQAQAAENSARAYKGHLTRLRNKIANGVCPVPGCKRHFDNVQAHIETVHGKWAEENPQALEAGK